MLATTPLPFALLLSTFLQVTLAAPRPSSGKCRCTIITNDFTARDAADLLSITTPGDLCASVGQDLEWFRREDPELYRSYVNPDNPEVTPASNSLRPLTTIVLMDYAARHGFSKAGIAQEDRPASTDRSTERIVCHSDPEIFTAYKTSTMSLLALLFIIALAVSACLFEAIGLVKSWLKPDTRLPRLQLPGEERSLKAFTPSDVLFSPGVEKKSQAYATLNCIVHSEKHVSNAYVANIEYDEDDDEMDRPVM